MRPTFTVSNEFTLEGEPADLIDNLRIWFENKFFFGNIKNDSFTIKEVGRGLWDQITDSTHQELATSIEGKIDSDKLHLCAELNTGTKIQTHLLRTFIVLFGSLIAFASMDWLNSTLILLGTIAGYLYMNYLIRKRIKRDLDTFIWLVNTRTSNRIRY